MSDVSNPLYPYPDLITYLRNKGIVQPAQPESSPISSNLNLPPMTRNIPLDTTAPTINQPSTADRLRRILNNPPQQSDYKPSLVRRIGGGLLGIAEGALTVNPYIGVKVAQEVNKEPYNTAYQDWYRQAKSLEALSSEEEAASKNASVVSENTARYDPDIQGKIAGAKKAAEYPYVSAEEGIKQKGAEQRTQEEIGSREKIAGQREIGEESRFTRGETGKNIRTQQEIAGRLANVSAQQAGANTRTQANINAAADRLQQTLGIQKDKMELQNQLSEMMKIRDATVLKKQADQNAAHDLLQKEEYKDLIVKDNKGLRIGTSAELLNKKNVMGVNIPGTAKLKSYTDDKGNVIVTKNVDDYNRLLLKYKHDLTMLSNGYIDSVKNMRLVAPEETSEEEQ